MPIVSPTLLRQPLHYPRLLPKPNSPYPSPLPRKRVYSNLNDIRDLQREMDDLSDEENELEDLVRSYFYYHPLFLSLSLLLSLCACVFKLPFRRRRYIMEGTTILYPLVDP